MTKKLSPAVVVGLALVAAALAVAQQRPRYAADVPKSVLTPDVVKTESLGDLNFFDGLPSEETTKKVYDYLDTARGVDAFLNGMPAASIQAFIQGMNRSLKPTSNVAGNCRISFVSGNVFAALRPRGNTRGRRAG